MAVNGMSNRHFIRVGQQLHLPRTAAAPAAPALVDGRYRVRGGDSLSAIADRFGVSEEKLLAINALSDRNAIFKGQWLRIEGEEAEPQVVVASLDNAAAGTAAAPAAVPAAVPETGGEKIAIAEMRSADEESSEEAEPTTSQEETPSIAPVQPAVQATPLTADPSDYSVGEDSTIEIQAEETLGHYAEWLQVRTDDLRKLNRLRGKPLVIGKRLKLDFTKVTPEIFEQQRITYHRGLQENYFARYLIAGTQEHKIRRGESIWLLAERRYNVPIWLLLQYNPDLDLNKVKPGLVVNFPMVQEKTECG